MHTCLFKAMADSCNSSSKEERAFWLRAMAVLQQIDDEEKKEKLKKRKRWWFIHGLHGARRLAHFML